MQLQDHCYIREHPSQTRFTAFFLCNTLSLMTFKITKTFHLLLALFMFFSVLNSKWELKKSVKLSTCPIGSGFLYKFSASPKYKKLKYWLKHFSQLLLSNSTQLCHYLTVVIFTKKSLIKFLLKLHGESTETFFRKKISLCNIYSVVGHCLSISWALSKFFKVKSWEILELTEQQCFNHVF